MANRSPSSLAAEAAFRARLAELGAEMLEPVWLGALAKHRVTCQAGHSCRPRPNSLQQGQGLCITCAGRDPAVAEAEFLARLAEFGATLLEPYTKSSAGHRVRCVVGHECRPSPDSLKMGRGPCRACVGKDPAAAEAAFLERLAELGATPLYEQYKGSGVGHHVQCANGHESYPRPNDVRNGDGICLACTGRDPETVERRFRDRLAELGAVPLYETWAGVGRPHAVRCAAGHSCSPWPASVLAGGGVCRACRGMTWDAFYVVTGPSGVKFGITSGDPRPRLRAHAAQGYREVVHLATGLPGAVAPDAERAVRAALELAGEKPIRGREYFDISCLALVLDVADSWLSVPAAGAGPDVAAAKWVQEALFAA